MFSHGYSLLQSRRDPTTGEDKGPLCHFDQNIEIPDIKMLQDPSPPSGLDGELREEDKFDTNPWAAFLDCARLSYFVLQLPSARPKRSHLLEMNWVLGGDREEKGKVPAVAAGTASMRILAYFLLRRSICAMRNYKLAIKFQKEMLEDPSWKVGGVQSEVRGAGYKISCALL